CAENDVALDHTDHPHQKRELTIDKTKGDVGEGEAVPWICFRDVEELNHAGPSAGPTTSSSSSRQLDVAVIVSMIALSRPMTMGPSNTPTSPKVYTPVMSPTSIQ